MIFDDIPNIILTSLKLYCIEGFQKYNYFTFLLRFLFYKMRYKSNNMDNPYIVFLIYKILLF